MNVIIEDETWEDVCENGHKVTNSPLWKEFYWKLILLLYQSSTKVKQTCAGESVSRLGTTHFLGLSKIEGILERDPGRNKGDSEH